MRNIINVMGMSAIKAKLSEKWDKYKMVVGYMIAYSLAVIFLTCWTFNTFFFVISLVWALSFLFRLGYANIEIRQRSIIIMWSLFCFGLCGILMHVLKIRDLAVLSALFSGFAIIFLYRLVPMISYYLRYNDTSCGYDIDGNKTKYNGIGGSILIFTCVVVITGMIELEQQNKIKENIEIQKFNKEHFVPVTFVNQEMYDGNTFYILEAKGEKFYVSPFEYPAVRNINTKSQVKVILGEKDPNTQLKTVKRIEFKN